MYGPVTNPIGLALTAGAVTAVILTGGGGMLDIVGQGFDRRRCSLAYIDDDPAGMFWG